MRICQIVPSLRYGGAEAVAVSLHHGLISLGHTAAICTVTDSIAPRFLGEIGSDGKVYSLGCHPYSPRASRKFSSLADEVGFDTVISHLTPMLFHARVFKKRKPQIPWFHIEHNPLTFSRRGLKLRLRNSVIGPLYRHVDKIVVVSPHIKEQYFMKYFPALNDQVLVIPNGIDVESLRRRCAEQSAKNIRAQYGIPAAAKVIGIIGRLVAVKGHAPFFDAVLRQWREFEPLDPYFLIVGDGALRESLRRRVSGTAIEQRVIFTGSLAEISAPLAILDALAIPSFSEGLPINLLEGAALGIPVVAMAVGGIPFVLRDLPNSLCPPGDYDLFCSMLRKTVAMSQGERISPEKMTGIGERFSLTTMVSSYDRLVNGSAAVNE